MSKDKPIFGEEDEDFNAADPTIIRVTDYEPTSEELGNAISKWKTKRVEGGPDYYKISSALPRSPDEIAGEVEVMIDQHSRDIEIDVKRVEKVKKDSEDYERKNRVSRARAGKFGGSSGKSTHSGQTVDQLQKKDEAKRAEKRRELGLE